MHFLQISLSRDSVTFSIWVGVSFLSSMNASIPYILLLGILGFAVSLYFLLQGLSKIGTTNTMLILSLSSVFGLVLAAIFLHEHVSIFQIIAAGVMLFGIYLINRNRNVKVTVES
jgi:drug/metabolite transporter (DMT)-like permease